MSDYIKIRLLLRSAILLGIVLTGAAGCMENIALFPRQSIVSEVQPDVVGAVERVDLAARRIFVRPNIGESRVFSYGDTSRILYGGREYPISRLAPGDIVAVQVRRDSGGESYVDWIRVQQASVTAENRNQAERAPAMTERTIHEETIAPPRIQTLSGTVQRINPRDNSFEIANRPNPIMVVLSDAAPATDREHLQTLQSGDQVHVEGKFVDRDKFEMHAFLDAEY